MAKKGARRREVVPTLLVVGEGACDKAFLQHLNRLFGQRGSGLKVTSISADGGSPKDVIETPIRKRRRLPYDRCAILMDSDLPIEQSSIVAARKNGIELILSDPLCLEGLLHRVLGWSTAGKNSSQLKTAIHESLSGSPTDAKSYQELFTKEILVNCNVLQIKALIEIISNQRSPRA